MLLYIILIGDPILQGEEYMKAMLITTGFILFIGLALANDSAVETSVGGLKLIKEHSVLMEKERLFISGMLVRVEYVFRNTTKEPVISEVAFPIPTFQYIFEDAGGRRDFSDFRVWIDEKQIKVDKEVRAYVWGREVTKDLRRAKIAIETFGDFDLGDSNNQIFQLQPDVRTKLVKIGALKAPNKKDDSLDYWPEWKVDIKYHWRQEFPPDTAVHVKHEYRPVLGFGQVQLQNFKKEIKDTCIDTNTYNEVKRRVARNMQERPLGNNYFGIGWVSYILTTANTWQQPIKEFELIVQREKNELITFCWDGGVDKIDTTHFRARKADFIPTKDLRIYFLKLQ